MDLSQSSKTPENVTTFTRIHDTKEWKPVEWRLSVCDELFVTNVTANSTVDALQTRRQSVENFKPARVS
jgi:hypothetical protein